MPTENLITTTHVGSLPRSETVRELLRGDADPQSESFDDAVTEAVRDVVRKQAAAGIDVANDGEQSRLAYSVDVTNRLSGFSDRFAERELPADLEDYPEFAEVALGDIETIGGPIATGPIEYVGTADLERDLARFDEAVEAEGVTFADRFHTAPSPGAVLRFTESEYHDSNEDYLFDLAAALQTEYETIVDGGAQLQIDAPELLAGFTITYKDASVEEFREHVRTYVEAINLALENVPSDRVRLHACWGNYPGPHHHDVDLDDVIDQFYEAAVSGLVVEGANPRHNHEHRTIAEHPLPDGWTLIPGVIDVKTNIVEHPETVADRLERFAESVGDPSRIVAGCDCGFETVMTANLVYPDLVWKKLEALSDGARLASRRLS
ncbi:methionine synthase [Natrononativus amylolyticus]|uniref:methionine synthase n=1 Tax=Natrononativus amylolyticus TaxID=2963434 RepID=UPI0020CD0DE1|nr:methionine synthase [Natrononativus amylolyticus]